MMRHWKSVVGVVAVVLLVGVWVGSASSGQRGGGGQGQWGGGGRDPAQMQQRMLGAIRGELLATDDEWKTLEPTLKKVIGLAGQVGGGEYRTLMWRRGGRGGQAQEGEQKPLAAAKSALKAALEGDASDADVTAKLKAFRAAREAVLKELAKAHAELREAANARQEANLVLLGLLD